MDPVLSTSHVLPWFICVTAYFIIIVLQMKKLGYREVR